MTKIVKILAGRADETLELDLTAAEDLEIIVGFVGWPGKKLRTAVKVTVKNPGIKVKTLQRGVMFAGAERESELKLDFQKGASGGRGEERDETVLIGEEFMENYREKCCKNYINRGGEVKNVVKPEILSAEKEVELVHAVTVAEADERMLAYLKNRGFSEREIIEKIIVGQIERLGIERAKVW